MKLFSKKGKLEQIVGAVLSLFFLVQTVVTAQSAGRIETLMVELWPEYDRPETLVIYRAELADSMTLPARVTFRLPGYLEKMHAIAAERDGQLVEVKADSIELRHENNELLLTFSTPVPRIQFEYYDPFILKKEGNERQLDFSFTASYEISKAVFQVQQPRQAENFELTPASSASFTGSDGLNYQVIERAGIANHETVTFAAGYSRSSDELSAPGTGSAPVENTANLPPVTAADAPSNQNLWLGYTLTGIGVILLLGGGGYWWSKRLAAAKVSRPGPRPRRRAKATKVTAQPPALSGSSFCYRCGATLREDANFCHNCGAERRRE